MASPEALGGVTVEDNVEVGSPYEDGVGKLVAVGRLSVVTLVLIAALVTAEASCAFVAVSGSSAGSFGGDGGLDIGGDG